MAVVALPTSVFFAVIVEDGRVVEIRPTTIEELATWMDLSAVAEPEKEPGQAEAAG